MLSTITDAVFISADDAIDFHHSALSQLCQTLTIQVLPVSSTPNNLSPNIELVIFVLSDAKDLFRLENWLDSQRSYALVLWANESQSDVVIKGMEAGADDYILNPARHPALTSLVLNRAVTRMRDARQSAQTYNELEQINLELMTSLEVLRQDQLAGRYVQQKMLPQSPWQFNGLAFEHTISPSLYLSGDVVDYFPLGSDRVLFYLADVSGHGASSAFITILLRVFIRRYVTRHLERDLPISTAKLLTDVNQELLDTALGKHLTIFIGVIDQRQYVLRYSNGAHFPAPILYDLDQAQFIEKRGLPVGLFADATYEEFELLLHPRYHLSLFSDGVFEVMKNGALAEKENQLLVLAQQFARDHAGLVQWFNQMGMKHSPDDVTMLTISDS